MQILLLPLLDQPLITSFQLTFIIFPYSSPALSKSFFEIFSVQKISKQIRMDVPVSLRWLQFNSLISNDMSKWFWETWAVYQVAVCISSARGSHHEDEEEVHIPAALESETRSRAQSAEPVRIRSASRVSRRPRDSPQSLCAPLLLLTSPLTVFLHFLVSSLLITYSLCI